MNKEDIIKLALEAGFESHDISLNFPKELKRFFQAAYAKGQVDEREACAKVCLEEAPSLDGQLCAAAIRARGETK